MTRSSGEAEGGGRIQYQAHVKHVKHVIGPKPSAGSLWAAIDCWPKGREALFSAPQAKKILGQ